MGVMGQDISSMDLEWNVVSYFEVQTGEMNDEATRLVTHTNSSIEWVEWDGTIKYSIGRSNSNWIARIMLTSDEEPIIYELTLNSVQKL